jgi:hypothetical protein
MPSTPCKGIELCQYKTPNSVTLKVLERPLDSYRNIKWTECNKLLLSRGNVSAELAYNEQTSMKAHKLLLNSSGTKSLHRPVSRPSSEKQKYILLYSSAFRCTRASFYILLRYSSITQLYKTLGIHVCCSLKMHFNIMKFKSKFP